MNFFDFLYNLIISPIEMIIEFVFVFSKAKIGIGGVFGSIVIVSLVVNFLALPLYNIADNLQKKERDIQIKMSKGLAHIKKTFSGDEKFLMTQEFYRINNYHPLYALRSSLSVLIEIPFFIAAYHFLSNSPSLKGIGFAFFSDLGSPDRLIHFSAFGKEVFINVLPILMTLINIFSGIVYLKSAPIREKIQVYGLAALFLVILYESPCGLVLYWILNNLFSLLKNIVTEKSKNPKKVVFFSIAIILLLASVGVLLNKSLGFKKRLIFCFFAVIFSVFVFAFSFIKKLFNKFSEKFKNNQKSSIICSDSEKSNFLLLIFSGLGLSILSGFLLPSEVIAASPIEFSFIENRTNPSSFVFGTFSLFLGLFTFWPIVIYKLFDTKLRKILPFLWSFIFTCAVLNSFVFRHHFGTMSIFCIFDNQAPLEKHTFFLTNFPLICYVLVLILVLVLKKFNLQKYLSIFMIVLTSSALIFGIKNVSRINSEFKKYSENIASNKNSANSEKKLEKIYNLSKTKKNVVVLFLDRAIGNIFPYVAEEFPELLDDFSGFKLYQNTVSFSDTTIKASPALMGGYEYTPENLNKRDSELLKDKHNESILVMPKLFLDAGFNVSTTNLPFPNYSWKGDLSFYNEFPEIKAYEIGKKYSTQYVKEHPEVAPENEAYCVETNLQSFALLEIISPVLRQVFYFSGKYFRERVPALLNNVPSKFLDEWSSLYYLPEITDCTSEKSNFIFIDNETTHEDAILQEKTYLPIKNAEKFNSALGIIPPPSQKIEKGYYHSYTSSMLQLAKWMKYLKSEGVYDNTRFIFVSDHGRKINTPGFKNSELNSEFSAFNALLMVKDFNATGKLSFENDFMTNADTLILATKNLPVSQKNPFTGKNYKDFVQKNEINIYPVLDTNTFREFDSYYMLKKTQFVLEDKIHKTPHYKVHTNIFDEKNWTRIVE